MRIADLSPDTFYATDEGVCVRPVAPVANDWFATEDDKGNRLYLRDDCDNPFSCNARRGVLVEVFKPTTKLTPGDEPTRRTILAPRAIKGTWDQYVEANETRLRRKIAIETENDRAHERAGELRDRLAPAMAALGFESVRVWVQKAWQTSGEKPGDYRFQIEVQVRERDLTYRAAQQAVDRLLTRVGGAA